MNSDRRSRIGNRNPEYFRTLRIVQIPLLLTAGGLLGTTTTPESLPPCDESSS